MPKETYRLRRLVDAIRLWPLFGIGLFFLPVLWGLSERSNVTAMLYLFVVWAVLMIGAGLLSRVVGNASEDGAQFDEDISS